MSAEFVPFTVEHLDVAAGLLAAQQRRLRARRPELPATFEDPVTARPLVEALLTKPHSFGVVTIVDGRAAAYQLGYPRTEEIWGRACWTPIEGLAHDAGMGAEIVRDTYAAWSRHWVERGYFLHYAHAPDDSPELLDAWFSLGFGKMQVHAIRQVVPGESAGSLELRRVGPDDVGRLEPLMPLIQLQLMRSPAYAISLPETMADQRRLWAEELEHPEGNLWLALDGDRAVGLAGFYPMEPGPMVPDGAWELGVAMTDPQQRRSGIMRALLAAGMRELADAGVEHLVTDWRIASLATDRSWRALGFRPTHYRLHRHIDERVAWATRRD